MAVEGTNPTTIHLGAPKTTVTVPISSDDPHIGDVTITLAGSTLCMPPPAGVDPQRFFPTLRTDVKLAEGQSGADLRTFLHSRRPRKGWVVVVDISGSVIAFRDLLRGTLRALFGFVRKEDMVSVVTFNADAKVELVWTSVGACSEAVVDRVCASISPTGGTNLIAAMSAAATLCEQEKEVPKHILLLTDGNHNTPNSVSPLTTIQTKCAGIRSVPLTQLIIGFAVNEVFFTKLQAWSQGGSQGVRVMDVERVPSVLGSLLTSHDMQMISGVTTNGREEVHAGRPIVFDSQVITLAPVDSTVGDTLITVEFTLWNGRHMSLSSSVDPLLRSEMERVATSTISQELSINGSGLMFFPCLALAQQAARTRVPSKTLGLILEREEFDRVQMKQLRELNFLSRLAVVPTLRRLSTVTQVSSGTRKISAQAVRAAARTFTAQVRRHTSCAPLGHQVKDDVLTVPGIPPRIQRNATSLAGCHLASPPSPMVGGTRPQRTAITPPTPLTPLISLLSVVSGTTDSVQEHWEIPLSPIMGTVVQPQDSHARSV